LEQSNIYVHVLEQTMHACVCSGIVLNGIDEVGF